MPSDLQDGLFLTSPSRAVYFVCGSRKLAGNPWSRGFIEKWLPASGRALVMTGGARGPDSEALSVGGARGMDTLAILPDGYAILSTWSGSKPWSWLYDLRFPEPRWARIEGKKRPLARNAFMADLLWGMQRRAGYTVKTLALVDPTSLTGGTWHIIRCLADVGIEAEVVEAPRALETG